MLLEFSQNEDIGRVVSVLRNAAAPGSTDFGEFAIDPSSIQAISSDQVPTERNTQEPTTTEGKTTGEKVFGIEFISVTTYNHHDAIKCNFSRIFTQ